MSNVMESKIVGTAQWTDNFTEDKHLSAHLMKAPEINTVLAYMYQNKFPLTGLTIGKNKVSGAASLGKGTLINNDRVQWFIQGPLGRLVRSTSLPVRATNGNSVLNASSNGFGGQIFEIAFEDNYFKPNQIVQSPMQRQFRIYGEPERSGNKYIYKAQMLKKNEGLHPVFDMQPGAEFSLLYNSNPELSDKGYSYVQYPTAFENYFTIMRMARGMSRSADMQVTVLEFKGQSGSKRFWEYEAMRQFDIQWREMLELAYLYGQSSMDATGSTHLYDVDGRPVRMGSGLIEQLKYSTIINYVPGSNMVSVEWLQDMVYAMLANSETNDGREMTLICGVELYKEIVNAIRGYVIANKLNFNQFSKDKGDNKYSYDYAEYMEFHGLFGCKLKLQVNWMWSNVLKFGHSRHPRTGKTLESYRGIILDTSPLSNGLSNLQVYTRGDNEKNAAHIVRYIPGMDQPRGKSALPYAAHSVDGWEIHHLTESMLVLRQPYTSGMILPSIYY